MSRRSSRRPPRLDASPRESARAPAPPSPAERLVRERVAGPVQWPGPSEVDRLFARLARGDRAALAGLEPFEGLTPGEARDSVFEVWGWEADGRTIDPARTLAAATVAAARVAAVAATGAPILLATAAPASLLPLHLHLGRLARAAGGTVSDGADSGDLRVDGRRGRRLRWIDGVVVVTDGQSLVAVSGVEAADELLFLVRRPALVVGDGPFASRAVASRLEVVAFAGLDAAGLAVAARRGYPVTVVPLDPTRPPAAYGPVHAAFGALPGPRDSPVTAATSGAPAPPPPRASDAP